jgi:hypothetical protein
MHCCQTGSGHKHRCLTRGGTVTAFSWRLIAQLLPVVVWMALLLQHQGPSHGHAYKTHRHNLFNSPSNLPQALRTDSAM